MDFPKTFLSKSRVRRQGLTRRELRCKSLRVPVGVQSISAHSQQFIYVDRVVDPSRPIIFWFGKDPANLFSDGSSYGFDCRWFEGLDLSSLQHAKCLVVSCADTIDRLFNIINFACEYGIPSIWFNRSLPPEVCYWSFDRRIHIDDTAFFWRDICQIVSL